MASDWSTIGALRLGLLGLVICLLPLVFLSDAEPTGAGVVWAYVMPALAVILFFLLLLDALMNRVFMVEQSAAARRPLRLRLRADLLAVGLLLAFWGPYFYRLLAAYTDP